RDPGYFFQAERQKVTRPIHLIGVDPAGRAAIGGFAEHLTDPDRRANPTFDLTPEARKRFERQNPLPQDLPVLPPEGWPANVPLPEERPSTEGNLQGAIVGFALASFKERDPKTNQLNDVFVLNAGDTINVLTIGVGKREIEPIYSPFVVAGYIKTEMAE